jgi:hypothetical protein
MEPSELTRVHSLNWRMNLQNFEGFIFITKGIFKQIVSFFYQKFQEKDPKLDRGSE